MTHEGNNLPAVARCPAHCKRAIRRHRMGIAKTRAVALWRRWQSVTSHATPVSVGDIQRHIGRMAANHNTHQCFMCKHEKHLNIPSVAERRSNLYYRDLDIEDAQDHWAEYVGSLSGIANECDDIQSAFGNDIHRSMLMTQHERNILQGERLRTAAGKG